MDVKPSCQPWGVSQQWRKGNGPKRDIKNQDASQCHYLWEHLINCRHPFANVCQVRLRELRQCNPGGTVVKNPPSNARDAEEAVSIPGREDPLEKEIATHSSILAWEITWTEEPGRLQFMGLQRVRHKWACTCMLSNTLWVAWLQKSACLNIFKSLIYNVHL